MILVRHMRIKNIDTLSLSLPRTFILTIAVNTHQLLRSSGIVTTLNRGQKKRDITISFIYKITIDYDFKIAGNPDCLSNSEYKRCVAFVSPSTPSNNVLGASIFFLIPI